MVGLLDNLQSYGGQGMLSPYFGQQQPQQPIIPQPQMGAQPTPGAAQAGILDKISNWFQSNPQAISGLAAGLIAGPSSRDALAQGFAGWGRGQPQDRAEAEKQKRNRAVTEALKAGGEFDKLSPTARAYFEADPEAAAKYLTSTIIPKPKEYEFKDNNGTVLRIDKSGAEPPTPVYQGSSLLSPEEEAQKVRFATAGRTSITNNVGEDGSRLPAPPVGQMYAQERGEDGKMYPVMEPDPSDPTGKRMRARLINIAGSEAERKESKVDSAEQTSIEQQAGKAETMLSTVAAIRKEIAGAVGPVTGTASKLTTGNLSFTAAGRVRSYVGALKSGVAMNALLKLKEASSTGSSGFGALSQNELQILLDEVGSLDPDNTEPDIFLKTLDRIEQRYQRVLDDVRKNVPPERLKELGLDGLVGPRVVGTPPQPTTQGKPPPAGVDPALWNVMTPEEKALFQ